jgi:hypothetical protein
MTSSEFVIWLKGFTEACNDFTATPKQWDRIKDVLNDVQDYDDNPDIDQEIDKGFTDWYPIKQTTASQKSASTYDSKVWSDQRGCWHYENNPEGFGYYDNSKDKKEKQQLND